MLRQSCSEHDAWGACRPSDGGCPADEAAATAAAAAAFAAAAAAGLSAAAEGATPAFLLEELEEADVPKMLLVPEELDRPDRPDCWLQGTKHSLLVSGSAVEDVPASDQAAGHSLSFVSNPDAPPEDESPK